MSKDIHGMFGPERKNESRPSGKHEHTTPKPLPYSEPVGPKNRTRGPGIGGTNHGSCGTQGKH